MAHKGFPAPQRVIDLMKTLCGIFTGGDEGRGDAPRGQGFGRGGRGGNRGGYRGGYRDGYDQRAAPTELTPSLILQNKDKITDFLKGLKLRYEIPGQATSRRTWRCNGLIIKNSRDDFFVFNDNEPPISVENYYRREKNYNIVFPHYPCLSVGPKDKNIHVPAEVR